MNTRLPILLTPNFSWVFSSDRLLKPFQRFLTRRRETVETVSSTRAIANTSLKPGVNEIRVARPVAS
jgi:hypothetical protein